MDHGYVFIGYRLFFALLGLSAVVTELATLAERGKELFRPRGPSEYARRSSASSRSLHSTRW